MEALYQIRVQTTTEDAHSVAHQTTDGYQVQSVTPSPAIALPGLGEARFVDPVTIAAVTTLSALAIRFANHWLKRSERGAQIDLRTTPATISLLAGVPAGVIVVIDKDGKATVYHEKFDKPEDVIPILGKILGAGAASS